MAENIPHEESIFLAALQKPTSEERQAYIDVACGGNSELQRRVIELLKSHDESQGPFDVPLPAVARTIDMPAESPAGEKPGTVIGPYKLLQQIGEGGMGAVYMAEQGAPVRRKVALKIIKPGMDTREVIARFEAERQALALMDHPNIARVLDGGATEAGRPYFVMELVRGVPITAYCDQNNLPVHERLELFVTVCHAVQHAHQKGIIHRDIKPSNVLVTLHDGRAVPKVIDFGVAKAIGQQLTDKTLFTQFAQMIGTPLYMSPEQAELTGLDVDTRADIYSLGVMLYELLTGTTPFESARLKKVALDEIRRMIREEDPPSPSARLSSTAGETQTAVAAHRHIDPKGLSRLVRGDLDWIVMKALEKDRNRRYETANGFAADLVRYLSDEPVEACPPSAIYRMRKFARRNRGPVLAAVLVLATLLAGIAGTTIGLVQVRAERDKVLAAKEQERLAFIKAEQNFQTARDAVDKMYTRAAEEMRDKPQVEPIRRALLEDALKFYEGFLKEKSEDPTVRHEAARAYWRAGSICLLLGRTEQVEPALNEAVALLKRLVADFPAVHEYCDNLIETYSSLAALYQAAHHPIDKWIATRRLILDLAEKRAADFPADSRYAQALIGCHTDLANAIVDTQPDEAERHCRRALELMQKSREDHPGRIDVRRDEAFTRHWLGLALRRQGKQEDALAEYERSLEIRQQLSAGDPQDRDLQAALVHVLLYVGNSLSSLGRNPEAEQVLRRAMPIAERLADDFPDTAERQRRLGDCYAALAQVAFAQKRAAESEELLRKALVIQSRVSAGHGMKVMTAALGWNQYALGCLLHDVGRSAEAVEAFRQSKMAFEDLIVKNPDDPLSGHALAWLLADCPAVQFRDPDRAVQLAKTCVQMAPRAPRYWGALGVALYRAGQWQAAVDAFKKTMELGSPPGDLVWLGLAMSYWQLGEKDQARYWRDQAINWIDEHHETYDEELRRYQSEATALITDEEQKVKSEGK